jgi:hypothetical protein
MPIHDWARVSVGTSHDFHQRWTIKIRDRSKNHADSRLQHGSQLFLLKKKYLMCKKEHRLRNCPIFGSGALENIGKRCILIGRKSCAARSRLSRGRCSAIGGSTTWADLSLPFRGERSTTAQHQNVSSLAGYADVGVNSPHGHGALPTKSVQSSNFTCVTHVGSHPGREKVAPNRKLAGQLRLEAATLHGFKPRRIQGLRPGPLRWEHGELALWAFEKPPISANFRDDFADIRRVFRRAWPSGSKWARIWR